MPTNLLPSLSSFRIKDHFYLQQRFSQHGRLAQWAALWLLDMREMRKIEQLVLHGDDETVMAFKTSQIGAVGMTAVSSAIISQLSSTTLQLPALSNIHWSASAFIIAALLFSILATMLACVQQQVLGTLNEPPGIRMWLSNGSVHRPGSKEAFSRAHERESLRTSVASLLLLKMPNAFLLYGTASFLIGFGLFLGFAWRLDLDTTPARDNNLAVLVLYVVIGGVSFLGAGGVVKWKMGEVNMAERLVGKDIEEGGDDDDEHRDENGNASEESNDEGEEDRLLGKKKRLHAKFQGREAVDHERMARALEEAARAHRELAKLMNDAVRQD